jgi:hypothetical protein
VFVIILIRTGKRQCCGSGMISSRIRLNFIPDPGSYFKILKG